VKPLKIFILLFLLTIIFLCFKIYTLENERRLIKEDLIELSKVKYGLFSVDEWRKILAGIITKKIEDFDLTDTNREQMRKKISELLYKVIDDFEVRFQKENSRSIMGILKGSFASMFGVFDNVKRDVPRFTEQILDFMNNPQNRKAVRQYIIEKMNTYADKTFSKIDYTTHNQILTKYQFETRDAAIPGLAEKIEILDAQINPYKIGLLLMAVITAAFIIFYKQVSTATYLLFTLISFVLLITGLLLPMIEIDARISSMTFSLLGETVSFKDQVLYYKSKSIIEVVQLLLTQSRIDVLFVGVLVFIFSVLFPVSKLVASILYLYAEKLRNSNVIKFLIFKTGKWSMADVMVIAIFMSYIGFSGIISEQLKQIEGLTETIDILTTNRSNLQTGFFSFTSFAILSLLIAHRIGNTERLALP
jgi:hypothetical protein